MNIFIVYAHPATDSFNAALCAAAGDEARRAGHDVVVSDLYAQGFGAAGGPVDFLDAVPDPFHYQAAQKDAALNERFAPEIAREQDRLRAADLLILQFPVWWGGPPAILKGWIDRVNAYGVTYADGTRFDSGIFKGRRSLLSVTTGGTPRRFSEDGEYGPIDKVLWPIQQLFLGYLGFDLVLPQVSYAVARSTDAERAGMIDELRLRVRDLVEAPYEAKPIPAPKDLLAGVGNRDWSSKV